jgi:hypothetical protein
MKREEPKKDRANKYEKKVKIEGNLDSVLKVLIKSPSPLLVKRKGNKKTNEKDKEL